MLFTCVVDSAATPGLSVLLEDLFESVPISVLYRDVSIHPP